MKNYEQRTHTLFGITISAGEDEMGYFSSIRGDMRRFATIEDREAHIESIIAPLRNPNLGKAIGAAMQPLTRRLADLGRAQRVVDAMLIASRNAIGTENVRLFNLYASTLGSLETRREFEANRPRMEAARRRFAAQEKEAWKRVTSLR